MPTIEIASINSTGLNLNSENFKIAIIEETKLESHRGLFYDLLKTQLGTIVHIGNPDFKNDKDGEFFAGEIVNWDFEPGEIIIPQVESTDNHYNLGSNQQFRFQLLREYSLDIDRILKTALEKSPIKRVCFLSDYQFGPEKANQEVIYTISDFWNLHNSEGLVFNTLYEMYGK
jgi:hypothetical protein